MRGRIATGIGIAAALVLAGLAGGAGSAPATSGKAEARTSAPAPKPLAPVSAADHARAAIRQAAGGRVKWRELPVKRRHRQPGERARRRWKKRRATGRAA